MSNAKNAENNAENNAPEVTAPADVEIHTKSVQTETGLEVLEEISIVKVQKTWFAYYSVNGVAKAKSKAYKDNKGAYTVALAHKNEIANKHSVTMKRNAAENRGNRRFWEGTDKDGNTHRVSVITVDTPVS